MVGVSGCLLPVQSAGLGEFLGGVRKFALTFASGAGAAVFAGAKAAADRTFLGLGDRHRGVSDDY